MWPFSKRRINEDERLLQLQGLTISNSPEQLMMPREKLIELATMQADNAERIIIDSIHLVKNTRNPDTRSSRLKLLQDQTAILERFNEHLDNRCKELLSDAHRTLQEYSK